MDAAPPPSLAALPDLRLGAALESGAKPLIGKSFELSGLFFRESAA